jgi:hypothetical protein
VDSTDPQNPVISATGGGGGSGDVVGPASSVDGDLALFDGITGKLIKSGGALAAAVRGVVLTGLSLATSAAISATDTVLQSFGKLQAQITDNLLPAGYIDGLKMVWVSGTSLTVTTGAAYIPGLGKVLRATSDIAKTGLSLTASTWYHVYLYDNAGTPDVEIVTTSPAAAYNGTARAKAGDTSRRYVGSIRTATDGSILKFLHGLSDDNIKYLVTINTVGLQVLAGGAAAASTSVSLATALPVTARIASAFIENSDTARIAFISNSDTGPAGGSNILAYLRPSTVITCPLVANASQQVLYAMQSSGSASGLAIWITGYLYER